MSQSDGSTADYYQLPVGAETPSDIADAKGMTGARRKLFTCMLEYSVMHTPVLWAMAPMTGVTQLQHLISMSNMNAQIGECFRAIYRYGAADHSSPVRDLKKIDFYLLAEVDRIKRWSSAESDKLPVLYKMLDLNQELLTHET